jgi:sulfopyruvate decarboxylase
VPVAEGVHADVVLDALQFAGITHVVIVPDTSQKTVLDLLDERGAPPVIRAAAEDDVFGICAGLWMTGQRPLALIQQLGIFAGVNGLRGMAHDQRVPIAILAALFGRDVDVPVDEDPGSAVRLCTPLLDALEIQWVLVEGPQEQELIGPSLAAAFDEQRASVVLLGAPTT